MQLSDYRDTYYEFSGKLSDVARHLAFAGLALIWLFRTGTEKTPTIPDQLLIPLGLFVITLGCDLLQYIVATLVWHIVVTCFEKKKTDEQSELSHPKWVTYPSTFFFCCKVAALLAAYWFVLRHVYFLLINYQFTPL